MGGCLKDAMGEGGGVKFAKFDTFWAHAGFGFVDPSEKPSSRKAMQHSLWLLRVIGDAGAHPAVTLHSCLCVRSHSGSHVSGK